MAIDLCFAYPLQVVELRALVQRVGEDGSITLPVQSRPCVLRREQAQPSDPSVEGGSSCDGTFLPVTGEDERFVTRISVHRGKACRMDCHSCTDQSDSRKMTIHLALYDYVVVDFFVEAPGCVSEKEFLQSAGSVNMQIGMPTRKAPLGVTVKNERLHTCMIPLSAVAVA